MLPQNRRVNTSLFSRVFSVGTSFRGDYGYIKVLSTPNTLTRFSVVVPRSVLQKAAKRNALKRKARGCIEELIKTTQDGFAVILFLNKQAVGLDYGVLCAFITQLLKDATILS